MQERFEAEAPLAIVDCVSTDSPPSRPPRLLVVDDSRTVRSVVRACVEPAGWEVLDARDAEHGAVLAARTQPDAILCDLYLGGMSGSQLCRLLRADDRTRDIPIVLMSGSASRRCEFWAIESGAHAFLRKSELRSLPSLLERWGARHTLRASTLAQHDDQPARDCYTCVSARLGHLLDATLFEADIARRIRGMASVERTVEGLLRRTASLLGSLLEFEWLALACDQAPRCAVLSRHPRHDRALLDAASSLTIDAASFVVIDEEQCAPRSQRPAVERRALSFGDETLGCIALACSEEAMQRDGRALLELFARELPSALRILTLLEQTQRLALTDALTGLANRRAASDELERLEAARQRHDTALSVAIADVDFFKCINDEHGHELGDLVLQRVARALSVGVRKCDLVARWGGEEFLLLLPSTGIDGAKVLCERLRRAVESLPIQSKIGPLSVTLSIGVTEVLDDGVEPALRRADRALYEAKALGRNRVVLAPGR